MWLAKCALNVLGLNWFERFRGKKKNLEHLWSCSNVVHTIAKHLVSRRVKDENYNEMYEKITKNARAKGAKLLFFIVK